MKLFSYKNFFNYFIIFYFLILVIFSLKVGITHDEPHHNLVWEINKKIYSNFFLNTNYDIIFPDYGMTFYGIGFQMFSIPFEVIIKLFYSLFNDASNINSYVIKHPSIVFLFLLSGIFFKKIIFFITKDNFFSQISAILYLSYPYLFGHSLFNTLDIPFLSIWLICTYLIIRISLKFLKTNTLFLKDIYLLALLTAFLLSIRISGVLIFFQYLFFLIFTLNSLKLKIFSFIKLIYKEFLIFLSILIFFFFLLHPNYWENPFKVYDSMRYMSQHIQTACTITLGESMCAQKLPPSYILIWLFFKLPILILFGCFLFPIVEKKIFFNINNKIVLGSLISTVLLIIFLLIFLNINLYDEIRQIMFLVPLIFIISLICIYSYKKKISYYLIIFFILFFSIQNIKIFPYNYLWLNNFSTITKVNNKFELDYWGVSTRKISNYFNSLEDVQGCIISNRNDGIKAFLNKKICFLNFKDLYKKNNRPFYVVLTERALNKGLPINCSNILNEFFKMNYSKEKIFVAKIYKCT